MQKKQWYYKMQEKTDGEIFYVAVDAPIKPERLCGILGIENLAVCLGEVTKEEYDSETE